MGLNGVITLHIFTYTTMQEIWPENKKASHYGGSKFPFYPINPINPG
jgi:hypothetical protein